MTIGEDEFDDDDDSSPKRYHNEKGKGKVKSIRMLKPKLLSPVELTYLIEETQHRV